MARRVANQAQLTRTSPLGGAGGQIDDQTMRKLFFFMGLQQPKQISKLKTLYEFVAPEKETADVRKRKLVLNQAAPVLNRIITTALKAPTGWQGFYQAWTGKLPGVTGGEAEYLDRQTDGFARLIASAFASEVGVATSEDVRRWKAIMPKPGDTYEERLRMSQDLANQIMSESRSLGLEIPPAIVQSSSLLQQAEPVIKEEKKAAKKQGRKWEGPSPKVIGATVGQLAGAALPFPASLIVPAAGAMAGEALPEINERLRRLLAGEAPAYEEQIGETLGTAGQLLKTGVTQAGIAAALSPIKTLGGVRMTRARALARGGVTIPGERIAGKLVEYAGEAPASVRAQTRRLALEGIEEFGGKKLAIPKALERATKAGRLEYTFGGRKGKAAKSLFEGEIRKALRTELGAVSPTIAKLTKFMSPLIKTKRGARSLIKRLLPWLVGGGVIGARR